MVCIIEYEKLSCFGRHWIQIDVPKNDAFSKHDIGQMHYSSGFLDIKKRCSLFLYVIISGHNDDVETIKKFSQLAVSAPPL